MATPRRPTRITTAQLQLQIALAVAAQKTALETTFATQFEALVNAARQAGSAAERARIKAVLEQALPGHEALVYHLAFETEVRGPGAAMAVVAAERLRRAVDRDLADAVDGFTEDLRARDVGRRAEEYRDRQFVIGVEITIDDAIARVMAEDAAK